MSYGKSTLTQKIKSYDSKQFKSSLLHLRLMLNFLPSLVIVKKSNSSFFVVESQLFYFHVEFSLRRNLFLCILRRRSSILDGKKDARSLFGTANVEMWYRWRCRLDGRGLLTSARDRGAREAHGICTRRRRDLMTII